MCQCYSCAIRALAIDAIHQATSGHPGMVLGIADAAYVLWSRFLSHHPRHPHRPNRDRFVLSAGHASMLLYALLHLTRYDLSLDDLKQFRQWNSRTPGHPEYHETPGVEMTTGPLGQGFAGAVGMAIAERWLATKFNREGFPIVDHYTYVLAGDGDLMEGIVHEAAGLAGHLRPGKLIVVYDSNEMTLAGPTTMAWSEDVAMRFAAYGWHVVHADGHSMDSVANALEEARSDVQRPSLIITRTIIGYGSPRAGSQKAHAGAFRDDEVAATKAALGWLVEPAFFVPQAVYDHMRRALDIGEARYQEWEAMLGRYRLAYPDAAAEWDVMQQGGITGALGEGHPVFPARSAGKRDVRCIGGCAPGSRSGSSRIGK